MENKMKKQTIKSNLYNEYMELFNKNKKEQLSANMPFDWDYKMTKKEFKSRVESYLNTNPTMNQKDIVKAIVDEQRYIKTKAQGIEITKAANKMGINISLQEARSWDESDYSTAGKNIKQFWDTVRARREELKELYPTGKDNSGKTIAQLIGIEIFGSE